MIGIPAGSRIYLACGHTDMRKGFDSLAVLVQQVLMQDPYSGALFAFKGRRGDLVKLLWWDTQGLCLFAKRLEKGRFIWPATATGKRHPVAGAIIDAAGRDRLARACAELEAGIGGLISYDLKC